MKYGLSIPNFGTGVTPQTFADLAHTAETAGWDGFFIWDHILYEAHPVLDTWVCITAIALNTTQIRIGPMFTPLPRRRPTRLARETVTIDHLSNGRLTLGVGIGSFPWEWDYLGEEPDMKTRGAMLDEGLDLLTQLWTGEPVKHQGPITGSAVISKKVI